MGINKPFMAIIAIFVSVLVVSTIAIPIIENAQTDTEVVSQNSTTGYTLNENMSDFTIRGVKNESSYDLTINGKSVDYIKYSFLLFSPEIVLQIQPNISVWSQSFGGLSIGFDRFNLDCKDKTLTLTLIKGEESPIQKTATLTKPVFIADKNGDYIIRTVSNSEPLYVNDTSVMYAITFGGHWGNTMVSDKFTFADAPATIGGWTSAASPIAVDPVAFSMTSDVKSGYNVITGAKIGENNATLIVPVDYTKLVPKDSSVISLLSVIPILLLLVPILLAVSAMRGRSE